jgi:hypothetical protein
MSDQDYSHPMIYTLIEYKSAEAALLRKDYSHAITCLARAISSAADAQRMIERIRDAK